MLAHELIQKIISFYETEGNQPGYDTSGKQCKYYIDDNTRCAIGSLLPPEDAKILQDIVDSSDPLSFDSGFKNLMEYFGIGDSQFDDTQLTPAQLKIRDLLKELLPTNMNMDQAINFLKGIQCDHDHLAMDEVDGREFVNLFKQKLYKLELQYQQKGEIFNV